MMAVAIAFPLASHPFAIGVFSSLLKKKTPSTSRDDNPRRRGDQAIDSGGDGNQQGKETTSGAYVRRHRCSQHLDAPDAQESK
jgi:hypothetical protein